MIRDRLAISPGFLPPRTAPSAQPSATQGALTADRVDFTGSTAASADARESARIVERMIHGTPQHVAEHLPLITSSLHEAFGTQTLRDLEAYGVRIELDSAVPEWNDGKLLLGLYDPRKQTVLFAPNTLRHYEGTSRARQIVIHETTHAVDDMKMHAGLEGEALEQQRARVATARDNSVFYASESDATLKGLREHFNTRSIVSSWAASMNETGKSRVDNSHAGYERTERPDGRFKLTQRLVAGPPPALLRIRAGLHALAVGLGGLPGAAALARKTAPLEEFHETITLRDGQTVEFTHSRAGCRMVYPRSFDFDDHEDIQFSKYAQESGMPREYLAESAAHFLSDAQSRAHFERVDPHMAQYLVADFANGRRPG